MSDIYLEGSVGMPFWPEDPHFTAAQVRAQLAGRGDVRIHVNSGGGVATEGLAIYHALRDHPGHVTAIVTGEACSAASLFVMAADRIVMRSAAQLMIHDPAADFTAGRGTEDDHLHAAEMLGALSTGFAEIYAHRAGITVEEARAIMRAETWYVGQEAVAAGFADEVEALAAEAPASFPYFAYKHAPRHLLSGPRAGAAERSAVLAMMCGHPAPTSTKEKTMPKEKATAALAADDEDLTAEALDEDEEMTAEHAAQAQAEAAAEAEAEADAEADAEDEEDEDPMAEQAVAIMDMVALNGGGIDDARAFIAARTPLTGVIAHYRKKGPSVTNHKPGGATARILRDERETRRDGMTGALVARMANAREVSGPARDFMGLSLAEMAAISLGRTGRVGRGADALRTIEMAFGSHSTSDLPAIFENALNKRLLDAYTTAAPSYRSIAARMDFTDFRPHPISGVGDWPTLLPVGEGGEIKFGTVSDKKETVALVAHARGLHVSRQMIVNDELGAIDRILTSRGRAVAAFEEQYFYGMMLSGANADGPTLLETTRQVFNTTDLTKAGSNAAITPAAVGLGVAALRKRKGISGEAFLAVEPRVLLTGPDKEFEALQLLAPIQAAQANNVNPYAGRMSSVTSSYITGNAWYLFANPEDVPVFMYGYLEGEAGPRMRMDEPFGQQGVGFTVELDFGVGAVDFRGGYKNAGS